MEFNTNLAEWISCVRLTFHFKVQLENWKGSHGGCMAPRCSTVPVHSGPAVPASPSLSAPPRRAGWEPVANTLSEQIAGGTEGLPRHSGLGDLHLCLKKEKPNSLHFLEQEGLGTHIWTTS